MARDLPRQPEHGLPQHVKTPDEGEMERVRQQGMRRGAIRPVRDLMPSNRVRTDTSGAPAMRTRRPAPMRFLPRSYFATC